MLVHLVVGLQVVPKVAVGVRDPMTRGEAEQRKMGSRIAKLLMEVVVVRDEARMESWWRNFSTSCFAHMREWGWKLAGWVSQPAGFGTPDFAENLGP